MNCNLATPPTPHCRTAGRGGTVAQNEMRPAALGRPDLVAHFNGRISSDNEQRQDYGCRDPRARGETESWTVRQGIPTGYRGVSLRRRTEARWAALFDRFGWAWTCNQPRPKGRSFLKSVYVEHATFPSVSRFAGRLLPKPPRAEPSDSHGFSKSLQH